MLSVIILGCYYNVNMCLIFQSMVRPSDVFSLNHIIQVSYNIISIRNPLPGTLKII